jgi:asparagine synthase (glutamine-hydrolysing)
MTAIGGIFNLDGRPVGIDLIQNISGLLAQRGPGKADVFSEGALGMVHRLATLAHETSAPVLNTRDAVVAIDGWIDNRNELTAELGVPEETPIAEVLSGAFLKWGENCFERIIGDFAAVLFDKRERHLICARDPFAMKPLYYWRNQTTLVFASEIPALFAYPQIQRVPNEETAAELLNWFGFSRANTLFKDIYRLTPGHVLVASRDGVRLRPFWTGTGIRELRLKSDAEYGEAFREVFTKAVHCRIKNVNKVGVRLSGGLDSSTVLATAAEVAGTSAVQAYSVAGGGMPGDESRFIDSACRHCGRAGTKVAPARISAKEILATASRYMELPDYPSGAQADSLKYAAQLDGVNLLLTGVGGDDWFFGSALEYADLIRQFDFTGLLEAYRRNKDFGELAESGLAPLLPASMRRALKHLTHRHKAPAWLHSDLVSKVDLYRKTQNAWDVRGYSGLAQRDTLRRATNPLETHLMEMEERSEWRFGLVQRHPFFDRRVAEFALSIPQEQKQRQPGKYKYILRHAMRGRLPVEVLTRTDSPAGVPAIRNMLLDPMISRMFQKPRIAEFSWIDLKTVQKMHADLSSSEVPALDVLALWRVAGVEAWARAALP